MKYYIWSHRHDQWWGPDRAGYTDHLAKAGQYTAEEAADITIGSCMPGANVAVDTQLGTRRFYYLTPDSVKDELETLRRL